MNDASKREWFISRALEDTGFFARRVLGMDGDKMAVVENGKTVQRIINRPHGGIRGSGEHLRMTSFLDNRHGKSCLLLAPRGSYKSSAMVALATRLAISNRHIRIFYGMHSKDEAISKVTAIRDGLVENPVIREMWGHLRGPLWRKDKFKILGADPSAQNATIEAFGIDKPKTGGHPDVIIGDDLVTEENSVTPEGLESVKEAIRMMSPLLTNGGILYLAGTMYAPGDAYSWIIQEKHEDYDVLSIDSGVEIHQDSLGRPYLTGSPRFPNLSLETLSTHLRRMDVKRFTSQYLNRIDTGLNQVFERHHFNVTTVSRDSLANMTGYMFMDTAVTDKPDSCYSVILYGVFDPLDNFILMDAMLGQWSPPDTIKAYVAMLGRWSPRCYHKYELMEVTDANQVFNSAMKEAAAREGLRSQIRIVRRPKDAENKERRIKGLSPRFRDRRFFVSSSFPRTYRNHKGEHLLWDPEGFLDQKTGFRLPAGFLVDSFVDFPGTVHRDIPDALSDMDRCDENGDRYARFCTPARVQMSGYAQQELPRHGTRVALGQRGRGLASWAASKLANR